MSKPDGHDLDYSYIPLLYTLGSKNQARLVSNNIVYNYKVLLETLNLAILRSDK